ncbi:cysteine-rich repeat secretory protein 38 [Phtheirospermum japonicum]|uniref:Cysteine-rich repeat secretory protein 38 n=1 Tax=Phtheirospermum japonicum TaxID=374723 RepID=A0A830DAD1_9LAMI|nr:cysteine-rich repeat secretory protein 38 [Phtheirospermum japonicum]
MNIVPIDGNNYLASNCLPGTYTPGRDNYTQSLAYTFDDLRANAPNNTGFRNASWAEDPHNRAYGLALCRGDVSPDECGGCLANATIEVNSNNCPNRRGAIIWGNLCLLKYSDQPFFGIIDTDNRYYAYNNDYASSAGQTKTFTNTTRDLLNDLVKEAVSDKTARVPMFANGNVTYGNETVYGMVQCTRDLSAKNCTTCLDDAIEYLPKCCFPKVGARVFYGSCVLRYEIYPFLN